MSGDHQRIESFFAAQDNLRLFLRALVPGDASALVGIVHGYCEHSARYRPLAEALAGSGIEAWGFDYRGHGQADGRRGHCDSFSEYVGDLDRFVEQLEQAAHGRPIFLLGHSLGGLILARWLLPDAPGARAAERGVRGLIFASPYLALAFEPPRIKKMAARVVGRVVPWLPVSTGLTSEMLTRDPEMQQAVDRDPLYNRTTTPRWFQESGAAQQAVRAGAPSIELPALTLIGEADPVALPEEMERFAQALGSSDREVRRFPGARHEIFNEIPDVRREAIQAVIDWVQARSDR